MTKAHLLTQYKHFKDLLENPKYAGQKKVWKDNVQHGLNSILKRYPEFEAPEEPEEKAPETKSKKGK